MSTRIPDTLGATADTSWKIQALDLSRVGSGVIVREERFGHLELPEGKRLSEAITVRPYDV